MKFRCAYSEARKRLKILSKHIAFKRPFLVSGVYRDWEKEGAEAIIAEAVNAKATNPDNDEAEPSDESNEE